MSRHIARRASIGIIIITILSWLDVVRARTTRSHDDGIDRRERSGVAAFLVPFEHRDLFHRLLRVDADLGVPACRRENSAVGAIRQTLLAGVLGGDGLERFEIRPPDVVTQRQRVDGDVGVGGAGDVVLFARGDDEGEDRLGVGVGTVQLFKGRAGVVLDKDHRVATLVPRGYLDFGGLGLDRQGHDHAGVGESVLMYRSCSVLRRELVDVDRGGLHGIRYREENGLQSGDVRNDLGRRPWSWHAVSTHGEGAKIHGIDGYVMQEPGMSSR